MENNNEKSSEKSKEYRMIGNEFFLKKKFYEALKFYNQSLCYGKSVEDKSLAAGNRSAVYMELKLYNECVRNCNLALAAYPKDKIAKIHERRDKAVKLIKESEKTESPSLKAVKSFIKLSHPANPKIPFIADCLKTKIYNTYGQGIYTTRDLNPGDIIAIENIRVNHIVHGYYERCAVCFAAHNLDLIPAEFCTYLMFCSANCEIWGSVSSLNGKGQKYEIDHPKILFNLALPEEKHEKAFKQNEHKAKTIFDYDWTDLRGKAFKQTFLNCFYGLRTDNEVELPAEVNEFKGGPFVKKFISITMSNQMPVNFYDVRNDGQITAEQAVCYLIFGSLMHHCCDPNVMRFEFNGSMVFYAAKPIKRGERLHILYSIESCLGSGCICNILREEDFLKPKSVKEMTVEEAILEFKANNAALKFKFADYRDPKALYLIHRNIRLMHLVSAYKTLPFIKQN